MNALLFLIAVTDPSPACALPPSRVVRRPATRAVLHTRSQLPKEPPPSVNALTAVPQSMTPTPSQHVRAEPASEPTSAPAEDRNTAETAQATVPSSAISSSAVAATDLDAPTFLRHHTGGSRTEAPPPEPAPAYGRLIGIIAVLLAAAGALSMWRRKKNAATDAADIQVMASRAFGSKHRLELLRVDGRRLLVAMSPDGIRFLCTLDDKVASFERALDTAATKLSASEEREPDPSPEIEGIVRLKHARAIRAGGS